jgi:hypothetical protein
MCEYSVKYCRLSSDDCIKLQIEHVLRLQREFSAAYYKLSCAYAVQAYIDALYIWYLKLKVIN